MLRPDYDRKVNGSSYMANGKAKGRSSSAHRDARADRSAEKRKRADETTSMAAASAGAYPPSYTLASPAGGAGFDGSLSHWRVVAEERERRVKELEGQLKSEREAREAAASRANQARV